MIAQVMIGLFLSFLFLPEGPPWPTFKLSHEVFEDKGIMVTDGPRYYLAKSINFDPINELRKDIEASNNIVLKHRNEAHITVITPPEFEDVLSEFVSKEEINHLADAFDLTQESFHIACIGRGQLDELQTYFLLIESERLVEFRRKIQLIYEQRGGVSGAFVADHYFAHITIGFTHRDLHESDGVIKNPRSCWARVILNSHD